MRTTDFKLDWVVGGCIKSRIIEKNDANIAAYRSHVYTYHSPETDGHSSSTLIFLLSSCLQADVRAVRNYVSGRRDVAT